MISAVIFDMDGILIDSEPFWRKADIAIFNTVGIELTEEMCFETMGLTSIESAKHWFSKFPWQNKSIEQVRDEVEQFVVNEVVAHGTAMPGVETLISLFNNIKLPMAVASSSSVFVIEAVLKRLNITNQFAFYHSAQYEEFGKPDPAVFLTTAKKLGVMPNECLVFEDSPNGVKAGLAAGMKVVAVPEAQMKHDLRYNTAHLVLNSLSEFDIHKLKMIS